MSLSNDARDMGQLLSYALRPKMRPGIEGEYGRLLRRYQDEMSFRDAFNDLLEGMQLRVLHAGDLGVVLTARRESVFAYRLAADQGSGNRTHNALRGLAHLGIAANGGSSRPFVPHRERSLEVFGNEKRLDTLMRTRLFTKRLLTLDLLRCFQAPLPLTAQYVGSPDLNPQLLIVENHATYASVLAAARKRIAEGTVGFSVGYGAGNQLPKAIGGAAQLDPQPTAIWYFGDLDIEGLQIAANAEAAAVRHGLPPVRPALPLYQALLSGGVRQSGKKALDEATAWTATAWLDDGLRSAAAAVLTAGARIAQETVGYEILVSCPIWW